MPRLSEILDKWHIFVGLPQPNRCADGARDAAVLCCTSIDTVTVLVSPDNLTLCLLFQPVESYASRRLSPHPLMVSFSTMWSPACLLLDDTRAPVVYCTLVKRIFALTLLLTA